MRWGDDTTICPPPLRVRRLPAAAMVELVLDASIRNWVLIPVFLIMIFMGVARQNVSQLLRSASKTDFTVLQHKCAIPAALEPRSRTLAAQLPAVLTRGPHTIAARRVQKYLDAGRPLARQRRLSAARRLCQAQGARPPWRSDRGPALLTPALRVPTQHYFVARGTGRLAGKVRAAGAVAPRRGALLTRSSPAAAPLSAPRAARRRTR